MMIQKKINLIIKLIFKAKLKIKPKTRLNTLLSILSILLFSAPSFADCYKSYSDFPKENLQQVIKEDSLLGAFYGCYKEDVSLKNPYIPKKNCIDKSKKKIGLYDVIYEITLNQNNKLLISVKDPFIGKKRSAIVRKICYQENTLILKTRLINIKLKQEDSNINLSFRFFFKNYFQVIKRSPENNI